MAGMLLFGFLAGCFALMGLPLLEDVTQDVACDTLVWFTYRQSLAYSLVAFSGGILGVSLLVAVPALDPIAVQGEGRGRHLLRMALVGELGLEPPVVVAAIV